MHNWIRKPFRRPVKELLPRAVRAVLRYLLCALRDGAHWFVGDHDPLVPPTRLMFDGLPDRSKFRRDGEELLQYLVEHAALKPDDVVLDVGCGIGRVAVALTRYLKSGRYEGFDTVRKGICWCKRSISIRHHNFRFQHVDVFNGAYNPKGKCQASEFTFPFESRTFDVVISTSVWTHMLPDDFENYVHEIVRVLRVGGRCISTVFLLNEESRELISSRKSHVEFRYSMDNYSTIDLTLPERAIAYEESLLRGVFEKSGLVITAPIRYGSWCGRASLFSDQDIVVAAKV